MMKVLVLILLGVIEYSVGHITQVGHCDPNIQLVENFNISIFLGDWQEHRTSDPNGADCASYKFEGSGNSFTTLRDEVNENFANSRPGAVTLEAGTSKLAINYINSTGPVDFWILAADPRLSIFALTYSCVNISAKQRRVSVSLLQRPGATLTSLMEGLINTRLSTFDLSLESLHAVSHSDSACYILPVIEPGNPIILDGVCDQTINVVKNFNVAAFMGVWHETSSYYSENSNNRCSRAEYSLVDGVVNVVNSQVVDQALDTITGTATVASDDGSARLNVKLNVNNGTVTQELLVLATDYTNYAISYTCVNVGGNRKRVFSWILSRRRQLAASAQADIDRVIASEVVLNKAYYRDTIRTDAACFYYPQPNARPVVFRGKCDQNIPTVQNFDAAKYVGVWHDIESYPSVFQTGTCRNANYDLNGGVVNVLNTQVLGESLDTMTGTAVLTAADGSGKLNVTFPVVGTEATATMGYWVLSTDYTSYSLVYSCEDLEETEEMRVWAWKLSRTKQLTQEVSNAINAAMANITVLRQQYFEPVDQSRDGCFYHPEPQPGVVVVYPGLCDDNINVMQNFNLSRFGNRWFEIEAYPRENQKGVCVNHECTLSGNSLSLTTSQVMDQLLVVNDGSLRFSSSNNSGRLILTMPGSGVEMPFWVLSTDYDNYAVAYSCIQRNDDYRTIYSWKFSRTKALSAASSSAIDNAIANVQVLRQRYYEVIDQSADACFYLPDLGKGEPVILVGTCDPSIPVVPNFNASAYLGKWRLIESYPSDFQGGTCNEATYTLKDDGITVFNTQVEKENLISETGSATIIDDAKLSVTFPGAPNPVEYWVLDTDYRTYSLVYSCQNIGPDQRRVWSWKLSRTRTLPQQAVTLINKKIDTVNVLNNRYYMTIDQSDTGCFYYPEADRNTPLKFRGKCDQSIQAVPNFNVTRYLGLWHNIELYPSNFQKGTCHNAEYTLRDGAVNVYNTQVVGQALDVMNGQAAVASTDGSAKLSVTFPVVGTNLTVTTSYWVLATDYNSYSLVYTCEEIDEEYRMVYSWKLSRTKQLSAAASTSIDSVTRNIKVLDERYYFDSNQTPEGCFYHPTPQPGKPVRYPGQCSENITVVQNFNLTAFQGIWYEIEAYPKDQQQGQCISHHFTPESTNSLNLQSSQVFLQSLSSNNGVLSFDSTSSNNARMTIRITVNGQVITIPFWILSTDYNDYTLAYSCVNQGSDYRNVYSWKLSRRRSLSESANSNINNVIANVNVLGQQYYEDVAQTPDACFYLPDLGPGEPVVFPGQCDENITVVTNFNPTRYLGRWRTIQSYASEFERGSCGQATYSLASDGQTVDVYNTQVVEEALDEIRGTAVVASTDGSGKLQVSFPTAPEPANYWILATDYDSYALVYSCRNISPEQRRVWAWKLSRNTTLSSAANAAIGAAMATINVVDDRYFQTMNQSDEACFYFPDPDKNTPVKLRGRCDNNIQVVQNFNVSGYLGLWHNIELYPSNFQRGTCHNAEYTLGDGGVNVFNTQVVGQALDVMNGEAVVASTDGSAKLSVTFPVVGTNLTVTTSYWVLATDYNSYSLVYTCEEIDEEYRMVYSWKLSRTKQLSSEATTVIDNVIRNVKVLDKRYYFDSNQTSEGCFYHPTPQPGKPVRYPGQCSDNVNVVQNFNLTVFQGIWYEIEAYPKDQQQGQCISHHFTPDSANSLNLQSSQVLLQSLSSNNGVLSFDSTSSNNARMTIRITVNGQVITIPFWILSTDYNDYTLAYSCVDQGSDYRNVYSWKLSRRRSLSESANSNINNVIANVDVLGQQYYEKVSQTPDACFYLPDLSPGEPVVFPGQCDENITVVTNFNPTRYLGRWRTIQSYASEFERGSCGQATYSLASDGQTVDVYNTQVVEEALDEIRGTAVVASTDGSGKLQVSFPTAPEPANYWILATDYDSYALVYSCRNISPEQRRVWAWKLSRNTTLSSAANAAIGAAMATINVVDDRYFQTMNQSDEACFYFPDPDKNTPVKLRGRCDNNIQVVQNFNVSGYLGLWHNIELYPSNFQRGTCHNAEYTLGDGGVNVFNTQVVGQALDVMNGEAIVASTDGSAKLSVTFPVVGTNLTVTTSYWVLATDYNSYSLVYTCEEIDEEYRMVYSWKLSRTKQLSSEATTAIDSVIRNVKVLDKRYYFDSNQTSEGCFYHPTPQPGKPVRYPGQCSDNVNVVQNFNLTAFQGIWYEVEAYPKDQQQGQCISHHFTPESAISLNLQSSQVFLQSLNSTNGVLSFNSTSSNDARMTIRITVNGQVITIPFWILSTDYNDYTLAYSCVNQGSDYRNVYSWKLSRRRTLSESANSTINNVIASVDVLGQQYYEKVSQTPDACFYFPDLNPGEPVVFPGQCNETIAVVNNFNPARYLGRWRTIQSYASEFEGGTCGQATYSLASDGQTVDVYNTQVVEETLDEMRGTAVVATTDGSGKLQVTFPTAPEPTNYWILATDYDSYALVYSCRNIDSENRRVWAWKLGRDTSLSTYATASINAAMNDVDVLDDRYFQAMDHTEEGCFYYPEMQSQPLRFRGRCNESIPVVNNFDVERYKGSWNDIESYPQRFQFGTCPTAEYTLNDGIVDVFNTQVIDQELDTISGTAVVASNDGSAKLNVTFPVAGTNETVSTPYWVLATDYDNYSLVYSCQNIDDEFYGVTSWKLSRSKQLSSEQLAVINETMASVKVLRQQYYVTQDHTEAGCFFYPDNKGGPVTWPGQCENDEDIKTVPNFNRQQFTDTWYEIEHIPSEVQAGECIADKYEMSANGFSLTKTVINNERLTTFTTEARFPSDDKAIMSVTLVDAQGENIDMKLYVLATDYNSYALLYGCRNVDDKRKQVYSYKLSRSQSVLTASAVESINGAVSERWDITGKYFEKTAQDNNACFYYPEYDGTENVIRLPGPCPAISGVANFNPEAYVGRWYEVARYPEPSQAGACNQATYTPGDGVVEVLNTQVVNASLETQEGTAVVASTDNTGQLTVTFVVDGETRTASYYVLATDYTSYSLVYNCRNTSDGWRNVFSWKLSRTKSLSNQATTAVNNVVNSTQGLLESYYRSTDQSDAACFYVPELTPGQAVRFRGRCDQYPGGMEDFDKEKYLSQWWHEIERYTSDSDDGECVSTRYQQSGNQRTFTDTRVFGIEDGRTSSGTVDADDNGRVVKTFADGTTETLWVMATDYDSYALLLSCEEIDDEYIEVWSTKQSRSRSLAQAAQDTLTGVIESNQLLHAHLYLPVKQTDDACFYYPDRQGQQIILPGRCDSNIPVQSNFNITNYTGTWYQIERYPYPDIADDSRCIGTRYTLSDGSDVIEVINWENVEDEVKSVQGTGVLSEGGAAITVTLETDPENNVTSTTNLYVLSTDYVSYSLVYTCTNYEEYHRIVVAAKLSRTRSLVASGITAINSYMAGRKEFNQKYFIQVEHDEECKDPSSAGLFGSSVIVTLVCLILRSLFA